MARFDTVAFAELVRRFEIRSTVLPPAAMTMLVDDERRHRPRAAQVRAQHQRALVTAAGAAVQGQVRHRGPQRVGPDRDRRRDRRLERGRLARARRRRSSVRSDVPTRASRCASSTPTARRRRRRAGRAVGAHAGAERGLRGRRVAGCRRALSDRMSADGWFRTGDVGRVDADGFVWIEGRVSDMINRGGLKVFPAEVVEVLLLSPARRRRRRRRRARRPARRGPVGVRRRRARRHRRRRRARSRSAASTWRHTRCRPASRRSTSCPATRSARSAPRPRRPRPHFPLIQER